MAAHNELGKEGEEAAAMYLKAHGYVIRHRDWHAGKKDLDIVAQKGNTLIIVEVKTRRNNRFGNPEDAVDNRKIRHIVTSTDTYLKHFEIDMPVRFDIVTVTGTKPPFQIEHIEDAFLPPVWE